MARNRHAAVYTKLHKWLDIPQETILTQEEYAIREACEKSFYEFTKAAWIHVAGRKYIDGWHIEALCEHLQALYNLEYRNLLVNAPPRCGKSFVISVLFPAWVWLQNANLRFLYAAYSQDLSVRDSVHCRRLITNEWYKRFWGNKFRLMGDVNNKLQFDNNKKGFRIASSILGTITGKGGDFVICDDPNLISEVHSKTIRDRTNDVWDFTLSSRFEEEETFRRIVDQQRGHMHDVSGHILAKNNKDWIHFCLPMEFEESRRCKTIPLKISGGKIWQDPRKKNGELLCPDLISAKGLARMKAEFNYDSYTIASQLQQRPSPAEGGIIKEGWFKAWEEEDPPPFIYIVQSWDTALTEGEMSCYSACTTWGVFKDERKVNNIMLLSVYREKVEYPDLRKMAIRLSKNYMDVNRKKPANGVNRPDHILIEAKVSGYSLLSDLERHNLPVLAFNPNKYGDKIGRCRIVSHLIENGLVWLQTDAPFHEYYTEQSQMFLEAAINFPSDKSETGFNDIVDSMSQAFMTIKGGWVSNKADPEFDYGQTIKDDRPYT